MKFARGDSYRQRCKQINRFLNQWEVRLRLQCSYVPSCNGIADIYLWNGKSIADKKKCTVMEAAYWYNVSAKNDISIATVPANAFYLQGVRLIGVEILPLPDHEVVRTKGTPYHIKRSPSWFQKNLVGKQWQSYNQRPSPWRHTH